jgi:uncharacterized protein involved in response to NO
VNSPPVLQHAFRLCFLVASVWAALAVPLWLLAYMGEIAISSGHGDLVWHAHEMIYGYAALVVCGFLFTAIPNWTNRLPVRGLPLLALVSLWFAGRLAMLFAGELGPALTAAIDVSFLFAVIAAAAREIVAGQNWRNLRVLVLILWLALANVWFHVATLLGAPTDPALRAAIGALIALIILIGGRIVPSFTRNWLVKQSVTRLPAPFGPFDGVAIAAGVFAVAAWVVEPEGVATATFAAAAAVLLAIRLARWNGLPTWRDPLLFILHLGYAFVPLGLALLAAALIWPQSVPKDATVHAWTAGAIGTMTLAVMTRASLGHTGRRLEANGATVAIYVAIVVAAITRIAAPFAGEHYLMLLMLSGAGWSGAFVGFVGAYGPILLAPRLGAQG